MKVYTKDEISAVLDLERNLHELIELQKEAFTGFSDGRMVVPMPMQLSFKEPEGDCHVKAGYEMGSEFFAIKIATGFYNSYSSNSPTLSAGDGVILILSQKTGKIEAILYDEGLLTQVRTAIAACIAAELTPFSIEQIGIVGAGKLARTCIELLSKVYPESEFKIWARNLERSVELAKALPAIEIKVEDSCSKLVRSSRLIVTTTASRQPIVWASDVQMRTHIIALGADEKGKQELDPEIFAMADNIIVDSKGQAMQFGDTSYTIDMGSFEISKLSELGKLLKNRRVPIVSNSNAILVTDLTGIAPQDVYIALWVHRQLNKKPT